MMNEPFFVIEPDGPKAPVVVSSPHSGTAFPDELKPHFRADLAARPDDTDWFVHELYDFVAELGITLVHARYSRWVIDLNRSPESVPLYDDGRLITGLVPQTDFLGGELYVDPRRRPDAAEIERRKKLYYAPYYARLESLLEARRAEFGRALLWDAHSIRRFVPTIQDAPFPDLILGDNDGRAAGGELIATALDGLKAGKFGVSHNFPFRGGNLTRHFGQPARGIHALQLEMAKTNYMDDDELTFNETRAAAVRAVLRPVFEKLIARLRAG